MSQFARSLLAELTPLWMTHQEPRQGDDTPTLNREQSPEHEPEKDLPAPAPPPPSDPEQDRGPVVPGAPALSKRNGNASPRRAPDNETPVRDKKPPFEPEHVDPPPRDVREAPTPNPNGDKKATNGS
jgi:hypothetical protein